MKEAQFQTLWGKYLKKSNLFPSSAFELKICKTKRFPISALKPHQIEGLKMAKKKYPKAVIQGHRDFSPDLNKDGKITPNEWIKLCPCFDAKTEYANL